MKRIIAAAAITAAALTTAPASAQSLSTYTYQGVLDNTGAPAQGVHEFRFRIFDAPTAGTLLCFDTRTKNFSADDQGRFTFDDLACTAPFEPGQDRWIEVSVRQGTSGPFTVLGPRRIINATPFAVYAENAATSLDDAYNNGNAINADADPVNILGTLQLGEANTTDGFFAFEQADHPIPSLVIEPFSFGLPANGNTGASLSFRNEFNVNLLTAEPDFEGEGVFLQLTGGGGGILRFDGQDGFTGDGPTLFLGGPNSSTFFDTNLVGDAAVQLPNNTIAANEILDEPGLSSFDDNVLGVTIAPGDGTVEILSQSIQAPADGFALVMVTAETFTNHVTGTDSIFVYGLSDSPGQFSRGLEYADAFDGSIASDPNLENTVHVAAVFPVTQGSNAFFFNGDFSGIAAADIDIVDIEMIVVYLPTAYGSAGLLARDANTTQDGDNAAALQGFPRAGLTPQQIAAEQIATRNADQQRRDAEMQAMQQRLADLERRLEEALQSQSATR